MAVERTAEHLFRPEAALEERDASGADWMQLCFSGVRLATRSTGANERHVCRGTRAGVLERRPNLLSGGASGCKPFTPLLTSSFVPLLCDNFRTKNAM